MQRRRCQPRPTNHMQPFRPWFLPGALVAVGDVDDLIDADVSSRGDNQHQSNVAVNAGPVFSGPILVKE